MLDALRHAGGIASPARLRRRLDASARTLHRRLLALAEEGFVERLEPGVWKLARRHLPLSPTAGLIVEILETAAFDAHLTGLDLLTRYSHQWLHRYPHLVYAEPAFLESVAFEFSANDFLAIPAGGSEARAPDLDRVIMIRGQPNAERYGAYGHVAPPEKAWVDLLRETLRADFPIPLVELGRILAALVEDDADRRRLRAYARQLGYLDRVEAVLNEAEAGGDREVEALRAGYYS